MSIRVPDCLLPYAASSAWVAWNLEMRQGQRRKIPRDPRTGIAASVSDPRTWGTLAAAQATATARRYSGIGIVSSAVPDLVFIDLDRCLEKVSGASINDDATRLMEECEGTYAEMTPSGAGLRIIGTASAITATLSRRGTTPGGLALEIYKAAPRYLTVTGCQRAPHPDSLADIADAVLDLLPLLGSVETAEHGTDGREDAALVASIVTGAGFHAELCALAARYIGRGMSVVAATETLRGMMLAHPEATRDDRWRDRFASIADLVGSAGRKYSGAAGVRRALARMAGSLLRDGVDDANVRAAVLAEAAAHGVDPERATAIIVWVLQREVDRREGAHA